MSRCAGAAHPREKYQYSDSDATAARAFFARASRARSISLSHCRGKSRFRNDDGNYRRAPINLNAATVSGPNARDNRTRGEIFPRAIPSRGTQRTVTRYAASLGHPRGRHYPARRYRRAESVRLWQERPRVGIMTVRRAFWVTEGLQKARRAVIKFIPRAMFARARARERALHRVISGN